PRDFCVQYRETDFNFASRLMEEEGIFYFFQHSASGHTMVVGNTPQSHADMPELSRVIFEDVEGGQRDEMRILEWEKVQELRSTKYTLWDHCFELPHKHLEAEEPILPKVQVGEVSHTLNLNSEGEFYYHNNFTCIPFDVPYRPLMLTPKPVVHGTQTAVVVGPAGEEIFVDKYGRVKVQFHWDRDSKADADSSCWIRMAQNIAGVNWGVAFCP